MSLIYSAGYFHVAVLGGRYSQGLLFASLPVVQAVWIPAYVWRKEFRSAAEAVIRSAAAAVAIAAIGEAAFLMTATSFGGFRSYWDSDGLYSDYVLTVLLFAGLATGAALGILRWRVLQGRLQAITRVSDSRWSTYLRSAILWMASVTVVIWLLEWFRSRVFSSQVSFLVAEISFPVVGLLLIAPIPIVSAPPAPISRGKLTWRYSGFAALVLVALWGFVVVIGIASRVSYIVSFVLLGFPLYLCVAWIACFFWAWLYACSAQFPASHFRSAPAPDYPARLTERKIIGLTALCQIGALLAGLLATAPPALGFRGIGCLNIYSSKPSEYWFWKGYKGISSEVSLDDRIIIRPSVDSSACLSIPAEGMDDPQSIERGYLDAACAWFGLIDPDEWESERDREIRDALGRLLGRDFSSYAELRSWWEQNSESLIWSSENQLLEVDKTDMWHLADPYGYRKAHPRMGCRSVVDDLRQLGPQWLSGIAYGSDPAPADRGAALRDREARLLGLKLYVDDSIEILTGERQRRAREFLRNVAGSDFETEDEWRNYLDQIRPANTPHMSLIEAQNWVSLIGRTRNTAREATTLAGLQERTGLNYANLEDFVTWLENPENTRTNDWEKASGMIGDLCLHDNGQIRCPIRTLAILKQLTGRTFDSPGEWVQWWHDNRANVALSGDGRTLRAERK